MEIKDLNKTNFKAIVKQNSNETRQFVMENGIMYEQLAVDNILYRHKLLSVRYKSMEALNKKARTLHPGALPNQLSTQGEILAFVCSGKNTLYYHLPVGSREQQIRGQQIVYSYAKHLVAKAA